jgi:hypothetical protein
LAKSRVKKRFLLFSGKRGFGEKRKQREKISLSKMNYLIGLKRIFLFFPTIKLVAVTGSLAMGNAGKQSDIDLLVITQKSFLWTTRLLVFLGLRVLGIPQRRFGQKEASGRLCLNMWLDETDLVWPKKDRNIYTAHEIAQVIPIINKDKTYEKFLYQNKWVQNFWPNVLNIKKVSSKPKNQSELPGFSMAFFTIIEKTLFYLQLLYMKDKITQEEISFTRAIFHPINWGEKVRLKLREYFL